MYIAISCPQSPGNISEVILVNIVVLKYECISGCRLVHLGQGVLHGDMYAPVSHCDLRFSLTWFSANSRTWVPFSSEGQQWSLPVKEPLAATLKPEGHGPHEGSTVELACCPLYWATWSRLHPWRSLQNFQDVRSLNTKTRLKGNHGEGKYEGAAS